MTNVVFVSVITKKGFSGGSQQMTRNVGTTDKTLRMIAGVLLLLLPLFSGLALFESSTWTLVLMIIGVVLIGTALINHCPLYRILGIHTDKS